MIYYLHDKYSIVSDSYLFLLCTFDILLLHCTRNVVIQYSRVGLSLNSIHIVTQYSKYCCNYIKGSSEVHREIQLYVF